MMFGQSAYFRATSAQDGEIERRIQSLEQQLERVASRGAASASNASDGLGDTIASVLSNMVARFSGGSGSVSDEAMKFGSEATKLGNDALRRLSEEVEHRPLVTLAVAVGVGVLMGAISRR